MSAAEKYSHLLALLPSRIANSSGAHALEGISKSTVGLPSGVPVEQSAHPANASALISSRKKSPTSKNSRQVVVSTPQNNFTGSITDSVTAPMQTSRGGVTVTGVSTRKLSMEKSTTGQRSALLNAGSTASGRQESACKNSGVRAAQKRVASFRAKERQVKEEGLEELGVMGVPLTKPMRAVSAPAGKPVKLAPPSPIENDSRIWAGADPVRHYSGGGKMASLPSGVKHGSAEEMRNTSGPMVSTIVPPPAPILIQRPSATVSPPPPVTGAYGTTSYGLATGGLPTPPATTAAAPAPGISGPLSTPPPPPPVASAYGTTSYGLATGGLPTRGADTSQPGPYSPPKLLEESVKVENNWLRSRISALEACRSTQGQSNLEKVVSHLEQLLVETAANHANRGSSTAVSGGEAAARGSLDTGLLSLILEEVRILNMELKSLKEGNKGEVASGAHRSVPVGLPSTGDSDACLAAPLASQPPPPLFAVSPLPPAHATNLSAPVSGVTSEIFAMPVTRNEPHLPPPGNSTMSTRPNSLQAEASEALNDPLQVLHQCLITVQERLRVSELKVAAWEGWYEKQQQNTPVRYIDPQAMGNKRRVTSSGDITSVRPPHVAADTEQNAAAYNDGFHPAAQSPPVLNEHRQGKEDQRPLLMASAPHYASGFFKTNTYSSGKNMSDQLPAEKGDYFGLSRFSSTEDGKKLDKAALDRNRFKEEDETVLQALAKQKAIRELAAEENALIEKKLRDMWKDQNQCGARDKAENSGVIETFSSSDP